MPAIMGMVAGNRLDVFTPARACTRQWIIEGPSVGSWDIYSHWRFVSKVPRSGREQIQAKSFGREQRSATSRVAERDIPIWSCGIVEAGARSLHAAGALFEPLCFEYGLGRRRVKECD